MEIRIGITHAPKEMEIDLGEDADRAKLLKDIETRLGDDNGVLWLTDKRGRTFGIPTAKVAYVEVGSPKDERRVGFGIS